MSKKSVEADLVLKKLTYLLNFFVKLEECCTKKFVKGTLWNDKKLWDHHNLVTIYIHYLQKKDSSRRFMHNVSESMRETYSRMRNSYKK